MAHDIRPAAPDDIPLILEFIRGLAEYEKLLDYVETTPERLRASLFPAGGAPVAHCVIGSIDGVAAGFALYFFNFSTFLGRPGLYLEDLYVTPEFRGHGLGKALLVHLARLANARGCGRMEWAVLDWNEPAIQFYRKLGAQPMDEWTVFRLTDEGIAKLAGANPR